MLRENKTATKFYILELLDEYINHPKNEHTLVSISLGADEPALTKLLGDYDSLQLQRNDELRITNENDVSIKEIEDQLRKIRREITHKARDIRNEYSQKLITKS
jgi:recombinational DNA repair ATPase RecF